MKKILLKAFTIIFLSGIPISNNSAQNIDWCHSDKLSEKLKSESQEYRNARAQLAKDIKNFNNNSTKKSGANISYTIPVVVHIVHENGSENIPIANVKNVIETLNSDFQKLSPDTSLVIPSFQGIIGDMEIQFRLATKDPNGNCTNGIVRLFDPVFTNNGGSSTGGFALPKPGIWPNNKYLNIYVVKNIANGAGAYALLPGASPDYDGIVCRYDQFGTLAPSGPGNFEEKTMPHEVGHWLNLLHPWGSTDLPGIPSNCNTDDSVSDTPNTIGVTGIICNLSQTTCGSLDNVQNIMDYSTCAIMFTGGQVSRAHATLNSSVSGRNNLWTPANLIATGTDDASYQNPSCPPTADFKLNNSVECEGGTLAFTNRSFHAFADPANFSYNWTFVGGTPSSSTAENPNISYNTSGLYDVSLSVSLPSTSANTNTITDLVEIFPGSGSFVGPFVERISDPLWPNNSDPSLVWDREKPSGSLFQFQRSVNSYYSAPASVYLNNFSFNDFGEFSMTSPKADLTNMQSGSTFLNFQLAHAPKAGEQEILFLDVSTDCGETFVLNKVWTGAIINTAPVTSSLFVPSSLNDWDFISHDISAFAGLDNVQFRLRFRANSGNNIWIDDLHISDSDQPLISGLNIDLFNDFNLYPNPNDGVFTMEFNVDGNEEVNAEIVDMIGKSTPIEFSESILQGWNSATIDTRSYDLKPGIYFLKLESGDQVYSKRLMIQ